MGAQMPTSADSPKTLTPRQQRFVAAYVACGNATTAALEAGYRDAKNEGYRLVHRPHIQVAVQKRMNEALAPPGNAITSEQRLLPLTRRARSPMDPPVQVDEQSRGQLPLDAVKKAEPVMPSNIPEPMGEEQAVTPQAKPLISTPVVLAQRAFRVEQGSVPPLASAKPDLATQRIEAAQRLWELGQTVLDRDSPAFLQARHELSDIIPAFASGADLMEWARRELERAQQHRSG